MTKQPQFPVLFLSINDWNSDETETMVLDNGNLYGTEEIFKEYYLDDIVADSNGDVFKITGREKLASWRKLIPFMAKYRCVFEYQNRQVTFNEVKEYLANGIALIEDPEYKSIGEDSLNKCHSLKDVFEFF